MAGSPGEVRANLLPLMRMIAQDQEEEVRAWIQDAEEGAPEIAELYRYALKETI